MTSIPFTEGFQPAQAIWPPILKKCKTINYVNAPLTPRYSRDIGRSFELGARTYYVFGDTFCNDAGLVSNTYQLVKDLKQPTDAIYLSSDKSGLVDPLIPLTEEEKKLEDEKNARIALWCFGGVVEVTCGIGYMWYQKHRFDNKSDAGVLEWVGVARISADELSGKLTANRFDGLMFNPAEPLMGSFSAMAEDGWAYVWGQMAEKIYLGRAPVPQCHIRESYWYWNGSEYVKDLKQAVPVMQDMQQGQIFRSDLFGNMFPWVFVGVTRWADNNVMIGVSSTIEGPWDIKPVAKTEGIVKDDAYKYCVYPHLWGSNESKGKLLVTWCDAWPGGVIAANLKLQISNLSLCVLKRIAANDLADSFHWVEIPLDGYSCRWPRRGVLSDIIST